ncbi:MAG: hypothetical protein KKH93_05250 [Candidatus Omnitrophica bacterium]|nr:hypothetical protein [Candidatus Omnitrophota bacterium]
MEIKTVNTQKVLSPTQISLADYVINPYKGCEFGCLYCYAQENKNIDKNNFFDSLAVKINAPQILEKELRYKKPKRVLLGSTTECFPAQELNFKVTGKILEILNSKQIPYTILAKSHLIANYLELISKNPENKIFFTFNFQSDELIRLFEKKSPVLKQRLQTIRKIIAARINLRVHIGPFIPYVSDLEKILKLMPKGVKEIDIELYHHKQGNFKQIIKTVKENLGTDLSEKLKIVYANKKNYCQFSKTLEKTVKFLEKYPVYKFYYILPGFDQFYGSTINYT